MGLFQMSWVWSCLRLAGKQIPGGGRRGPGRERDSPCTQERLSTHLEG